MTEPRRRRRAAIYARVSTDRQKPENQLEELRRYVRDRGWVVAGEYVDHAFSGASRQRPELDRLMADARRRKLDVVLVARFDRFARSVRHLLEALEYFRELDVDFVSTAEAIDTSTSVGRVVFTMVGAIAEFERSLIGERVRAGIAHARSKGIALGRPRAQLDLEEARRRHGAGESLRAIARDAGVHHGTLARRLETPDHKRKRSQ